MKMKCLLTGLTLMLAVLTMRGAALTDSVTMLKAQADELFNSEQYSKALDVYIDALDAAERAGDRRMSIAITGNIANIYAISDEYERCEHYIKMGYEAATKQGDTDLTAKFIINSVGIYCAMNDAARARRQLELMNTNPLTDTVLWRFYTIHYAGDVCRLEGNYERAHQLAAEALDYALSRRMGLRYELVEYSELASIALAQERPLDALPYLRQHLHKADSADSRELYATSCHMLAEAYQKAGYEDSAQFYSSIYNTLRDSVIDQRQLAAAKEKLYQYENRRTQGRISSLNDQVTRQWWLLAAVVIISIIALTLLYIKRNKTIEAPSGAVGGAIPSGAVGGAIPSGAVGGASPAGASGSSEASPSEVSAESSTLDRTPIHLNDEQVRELADRIDAVMSDVSIISDTDFSLQQLAQLVDSNTKYVSYTINEVHGKTFKNLLNERRIDEAARRLQDHEHYGNITIQGIYQELGYNSAAAFIHAFKKLKGMTPSQFQKAANA